MSLVRYAKVVAVLAAGMLFNLGAAFAAPILDQDFAETINMGFCGDDCEWQQGFTSGMTGQLAGIRVFGLEGIAEIRIAYGAPWIPGGWAANVLVELSGPDTTGKYVDLMPFNLYVNAGDEMTLGFLAGPNSGAAPVGAGSTYANAGPLYVSWGGEPLHYPDWNMAYQTFMAGPVPEPETYAMFMAGLTLLGAVAKRKRQSA